MKRDRVLLSPCICPSPFAKIVTNGKFVDLRSGVRPKLPIPAVFSPPFASPGSRVVAPGKDTMRGHVAPVILALCTVSAGCGPLVEASRTLIIQPYHYCRPWNACDECQRNKRVAETIW